MKIILIRHGETFANELYNTEDRILIGALESPLTHLNETGVKQAQVARELVKEIPIDEIYSSDLTRAIQTTQILFPNQTFETTSLLRERSLGSSEGLKAVDVFTDETVWKYHVNTEKDSLEECLTKKPIDGENYLDVLKRCRCFLNQFNFNEDKTIVLVAHYHFIRCMIYILLNKKADKNMFKMEIPNATPLIFEYTNDQFQEKKIQNE